MNFSPEELSKKLDELLKQEVSTISYDTWVSKLKVKNIDGNHIVIEVKDEMVEDFLVGKFSELVLNTLKYITNRECTFSVVLEKDELSSNKINISEKNKNISEGELYKNHQSLNKNLTFNTFVVGNNNRFAHAAALAVANDPGSSYNPLYIYGGVGLGKTHLMYAIGNKILENNPKANVLYVTSEKFTNQLINAIQDGKNELFRNKYRNIDALIIDDIQFIAGKDRCQEEFFHTFNALRDEGKQIIISSDKLPKDIELLEDRLKSRFEGGLLADIGNPDYETRYAILRKKSQDKGIIIDDLILSDIATKVDSNIRELEGVFSKIVAIADLTHSQITIELAEKIINEFKYESEKIISCDFIKETISKYFSINKEELSGSKRSTNIAFPRQIAMYLCREIGGMSFPQIGKDFGNRDHSTVMHAYNKISKEMKEKNSTKLIVESVQNIITNEKN